MNNKLIKGIEIVGQIKIFSFKKKRRSSPSNLDQLSTRITIAVQVVSVSFIIQPLKIHLLDAINFKSSVCRSEFLATDDTQANAELAANPKAPETNKTSGLA